MNTTFTTEFVANLSLFDSIDNFANNHTCILNQQAMMRATDNLYKASFWIALLMLVFLIFWFYIQPRYKILEDFCGLETLKVVFGLNILLMSMLLYTNLGLSEHALRVIELILTLLIIGLGVWIFKALYKKFKGKE
jgi:dolichol kinase